MSAFVVSNLHLSVLVDAAATDMGLMYFWHQTRSIRSNIEDRERIFSVLLQENYASVNARYERSDQPGPGGYVFTTRRCAFSPVQILKALKCYEYQSCEHEGWEASEAHAICKALRDKMICALDGYEAADWAIG